MPLFQRVPKKGFTNRFRKVNEIVNLGDLAIFGEGATVDAAHEIYTTEKERAGAGSGLLQQ